MNIPAMRANQVTRYSQSETGPARSCRAGEGLEQLFARPRRETGTVVPDMHDQLSVVASGRNLDLRRPGFDGILPEVGKDTEQLLPVRFDLADPFASTEPQT